MSKIIIAGDSWGRGEWGWDGNLTALDPQPAWVSYYNNIKGANWPTTPPLLSQINSLPSWIIAELKNFGFNGITSLSKNIGNCVLLHRGLEQYFVDDGHTVINISIGGGSNVNIVNRLKNLVNKQIGHSLIIWIQTDPFRDLHPYTNFKKDFSTYEQLILWQTSQLNSIYTQLNKLGSKIYMLGGCSKLNLSLLSEHKNLIPLFESITEFLLPSYTHPEIWCSDWYKLIDKQFDIDSINKLVYNKKIQDSLLDYPDLFWPDGRHPNRFGHKKIFDYINENIFKQS